METQTAQITTEQGLDILGLNIRLQVLEAVEETGSMDIYFNYDIHREWVEVAEGGYIVESGYLYHPINITIERVIHEHFGEVKITYLNETTINYIKNYIKDEIYNEANGIY
jgi:hypothetical protein